MATPTSPAPTAPVGYIGYGLVWDYPVRGMSFNVKAHQQIFHGDPATNNADQPIYHVGPLEVDGDVSWPIIIGDPVTYKIVQVAINRIIEGGNSKKTLEKGDIVCWFPPATGTDPYMRQAGGCMVNRLSFKGTAGERVEASINVIGLTLSEGASESNANSKDSVPFDMGRVMTWGDVLITAKFGDGADTDDGGESRFAGCSVKEFTLEINNNVTRANTFCWPYAEDGTKFVAAATILGRRQVSGSLAFVGSASTQGSARQNMITEAAGDELVISMGARRGKAGGMMAKLHRVTYELQQIDLSSGVIYGRTNFTAHGGGPGEPSIEFTLDAQGKDTNQRAWQKSLNDLDRDMSQRKL